MSRLTEKIPESNTCILKEQACLCKVHLNWSDVSRPHLQEFLSSLLLWSQFSSFSSTHGFSKRHLGVFWDFSHKWGQYVASSASEYSVALSIFNEMILSVIWFGINREAYSPTKMQNVLNNISKILSREKVTQTLLSDLQYCRNGTSWLLWYLKYSQFSLVPDDPNNCLEISFSYLLFINFPSIFIWKKLYWRHLVCNG